MIMKRVVLFLFGSFSLLSCKKEDKLCKAAICTMEVRSVGLVLRTAQGVLPPSVDYCKTYFNGQLLYTGTVQVEGSNCLVNVLDDSHRTKFTLNKEQNIQVRIFQQGVVTQEVSIGILADCCHINRLGGVDTVTVQ
jgi:hypothetical protein